MATTLLDLVRQRRIELEASLGSEGQITDERRIWAIMALAAKAEEGDEDARARLKAVQSLFREAGSSIDEKQR